MSGTCWDEWGWRAQMGADGVESVDGAEVTATATETATETDQTRPGVYFFGWFSYLIRLLQAGRGY